MTLSTPWSEAMGLRVPILNAPMGGAAGGRLAAAVVDAGGLGMIGMGSAARPPRSPLNCRNWAIRQVRSASDWCTG